MILNCHACSNTVFSPVRYVRHVILDVFILVKIWAASISSATDV